MTSVVGVHPLILRSDLPNSASINAGSWVWSQTHRKKVAGKPAMP